MLLKDYNMLKMNPFLQSLLLPPSPQKYTKKGKEVIRIAVFNARSLQNDFGDQ